MLQKWCFIKDGDQYVNKSIHNDILFNFPFPHVHLAKSSYYASIMLNAFSDP